MEVSVKVTGEYLQAGLAQMEVSVKVTGEYLQAGLAQMEVSVKVTGEYLQAGLAQMEARGIQIDIYVRYTNVLTYGRLYLYPKIPAKINRLCHVPALSRATNLDQFIWGACPCICVCLVVTHFGGQTFNGDSCTLPSKLLQAKYICSSNTLV